MFIEVMGKYPDPLYDVLAVEPGARKTVVDLGCGSGSWCVALCPARAATDAAHRVFDVAHDFRHVNVVAVDLIPLQATCVDGPCPSVLQGSPHPSCRHMPPNCRYTWAVSCLASHATHRTTGVRSTT